MKKSTIATFYKTLDNIQRIELEISFKKINEAEFIPIQGKESTEAIIKEIQVQLYFTRQTTFLTLRRPKLKVKGKKDISWK